MNKLIRLSPTGIEYGDYAWNFASGCGNNIDGKCKAGGFKCWAYSISQRFEGHYPNGFKPTVYLDAIESPLYLKKPSRILCAFMGDLFWECPEFSPSKMISVPMVPGLSHAEPLREQVFRTINQCPQHTFVFLTKQPQNLIKFSPFPDNCWVGVSITKDSQFDNGLCGLLNIQTKKRYISFEPLLERIKVTPQLLVGIDWVIIGAQTKPYKPPEWEWVSEIIDACVKAGIPYFLKNNLEPIVPKVFGGDGKLIQEMPK